MIAEPLSSLVEFQETICAGNLDVEALLRLAAYEAQRLTQATTAAVMRPDDDDLVCQAATGTAAAEQVGSRSRIDASFCGLAFRSGVLLFSDDATVDPRVDRFQTSRQHLRSIVAAPLQAAQRRFGVLAIGSPLPNAFNDDHHRIIRLLAGLTSQRMELVEEVDARQILLAENAIALSTLRESEDRFRHAFDDSGIGMALVAIDGRCLKVNSALCRALGYSAQELHAGGLGGVSHPDDRLLEQPFLKRMVMGEGAICEVEKRYLHSDGSVVWGLLTISIVNDRTGQPIYLIAQLQDITLRKQAEAALHQMAVRDDLTGLYNRREMSRLLKEETARAQRHERPLSLMMLDVDSFKLVNDTYGHQAGDQVLRQLAAIVDSSVRTFDRVARYGGEEFAVIVPETSQDDALLVAERIRAQVAEHRFVVTGTDEPEVRIPLTVSVGVASMSGADSYSAESLIKRADECLYAAKTSGKNRCVAPAPVRRSDTLTTR